MATKTKNTVDSIRTAAAVESAKAERDLAKLKRKTIRLQSKALDKAVSRPRGGYIAGGREPSLMTDGAGVGASSIRGGYDTTWTRARPDGGRGRGGSAQSFLTEAVRRQMRLDCQHLDRTNPLARALISRCSDLSAFGFTLQCGSKDAKWNKAAEKFFIRWCKTTGYEARNGAGCDITGTKTFGHMVYEVERAMHIDGDLGAVLTNTGAIQMIESERIKNPWGLFDTNELQGGVRLDENKHPVSYCVADWSDYGAGQYAQWTTYDVPADSFILMVNPGRARFNQFRGEPSMAAVIERFEHLTETAEAVRLAYYVAACHAAIISTEQPGLEQGLAAGESVGYDDGTVEQHEYMQPGTIKYTRPNTRVYQITPQHPSTPYDSLRTAEITDISADTGLPLVLFLLDFSKVNFSSARSAVVTAFKMLKRRQQYLIDNFLSRVFRWRIAMAIRRGEIEGFDRGYAPEGWDDHRWIAPPPPVLDVLNEVQAAALADEKKLKTFAQIIGELNGSDYEEVTERLAFEAKDREAKGILPIADPGANNPNGDGGGESNNGSETESTPPQRDAEGHFKHK